MRIILLVIFLGGSSNLLAQVVGGVQSKGMDMNAQPYGFVKQISADTKEVVGDVYLNEWALGSIEFVNGAKINNKEIRYNIENDFLEIKLDGTLKGSDGKDITSFVISNNDKSDRYVRANKFEFEGTHLLGFLKEIQTGNYSLYSKTHVKLVKGQYVAALDMGEEDDEYSKKTVFYLATGNKLIEINTKKKVFVTYFPGVENDVKSFIEETKLNLKTEKDLVKVFTYANTLTQ